MRGNHGRDGCGGYCGEKAGPENGATVGEGAAGKGWHIQVKRSGNGTSPENRPDERSGKA